MKNKLKIISLALSIITIISCLTGCGIEKSYNEILGTNIANGSENNLYTESMTLKNNSTEKNNATNADFSEKTDDNNIVTTTLNGGKEVMVKSNPSLTPLTISSGGTSSYQIVSYYNLSLASMTTFMSDLTAKTGATFTATVASQATNIGSGKQIVIGAYSNIRSMNGAPKFKSWTGGSISVSGDTIFIGVVDSTLLSETLTCFISKIKSLGSGTYIVPADLKVGYDRCAISEYIPPLTATNTVTGKGTYSAGGGNYQITYQGVRATDISTYCSTLLKEGFTLQQQNTINTNQFYLYVKGDTIVHINWFAKLNQFSIIYGPKTYVPAKKAITGYTKKTTPTISMLALGEIGTSIVIQLEDGSFVLIDGGRGNGDYYNKDSTTLWNFLISKVPSGEKPRIKWIVTHIHTDHRKLVTEFLPKYKSKIELELLAWNMPDFNAVENSYTKDWSEPYPAVNYVTPVTNITDMIKTNFPKTPIYTFHTGEKLYLPGCEIEFLVCHEDYYLNKFKWINDTSAAFRVTMQGKTMMVFGDVTHSVSDAIITPVYGNYIKSDILQIAHHGNGEGTLATYKAVDPDICLWSAIKSDFEKNIKQNDQNKWLYASSGDSGQRARKHYHHSSTTTITIPSLSVKQTQVYT